MRPGARTPGVATAAMLAVVAAVALAGVVLLAAATGQTHHSAADRLLGPTNPSKRIAVSLILRVPGSAQLARYLNSPPAPALKPTEFGRRFGLSGTRIRSLEAELTARRLKIERTFPQRTAMEVTGSAGELENVFSTKLVNRVDGHGLHYYAPLATPTIPGWLHGYVAGVTGLDTRPVLRAEDVPVGGLDPQTLSRAYDFAPLRAQGVNGAGQTIAVVSFDSFADGDLSSYDSHFGIQGPPVQHVSVNGGTFPGSGQQEVNLDIDTIRAIAPGAQILDYEAPQGTVTMADVINQIVADRRARVISTSWGRCDLLVPDAERIADENALAAARAAGITVFAASGDNGAYDCQAENLSDQRASVDWPAASASVVAVGGTRLAVRQDGSYLAEYGWEDVLKGDGSGGGLASVTQRPAWQVGPGVQNQFSDGHRQLPDVAGPADPDSGMVVVSRGAFHQIGGTSAAAPFWAATLLLAREYGQRHHAADPGFIGPALYRLASDPRTAGAFHHAVRGGNRRFSVTTGWNYVSGLGSPDVAVLARELAAPGSAAR